jgi:hypothetical protein
MKRCAWALLALSACGGGVKAPATPTAYCLTSAQYEDKIWARCYGGLPSDYFAPATAFCAPLDGLLSKGTISFDASKVVECLLREENAPLCDFSADCFSDVVVGHVADGAPCTHVAECAPGRACAAADRASCAVKTCVVVPPPSVAPQDVLAKEGEPCQIPGNFITCEPGLGCQPDGSGGGICRVATAGSPCHFSAECLPVDFCDVTCKRRLGFGVSCAGQEDDCYLIAHCDATSKVCTEGGHAGEPCGGHGFCADGACTTGLGGDPICLANAPAGTPCNADVQCASGVCAQTCAACTP